MAKREIVLLGRPCHLVTIRDNTSEVVADDLEPLTDAEWAEYCRLLRQEVAERQTRRKAVNLAAFKHDQEYPWRIAMKRIVVEARHLAKDCPPSPHACPACEILHVAEEALKGGAQ